MSNEHGWWVLVKNEQPNLMVAVKGHDKSYTTSIKYAKRYLTKELAQKDACGNEHPRRI